MDLKVSQLADALKPYMVKWIEEASRATTVVGSGGTQIHDIGGPLHAGALRIEQAPWSLLTDGTRTLTGNLAVDSGITIDGIDISAHAADVNAHHAKQHAYDSTTDHSGTLSWTNVNKAGSNLSDLATRPHSQLTNIGPDDHHARSHSIISSSDHTLTGGKWSIVGATATNTLGLITPITSSIGPVEGILKSDATGALELVKLRTQTLDTNTGQSMTLQPADHIILSPGGNQVRLSDGKAFRTVSFTSGFAGAGFQIDQGIITAGKTSLETDNLTVRGTMSVYELLIRQIRATNGSVIVSSVGKVKTVSGSGPYTIITDPEHGFLVGDLIRAQRFTGAGVYQSNLQVTAVTDTYTFTATLTSGNAPAIGYEYVRLGSTSNVNRRGGIYLTADDTGAPFIDVWNDVDAFADWNTAGIVKVRVGRLDGITAQTNEYGLIAGNSGWGDTGQWLKVSSLGAELHNIPIKLYSGATQTVNLSASGTDIWIGPSSSDKRVTWDGTSLTIGAVTSGNVLITGGNVSVRTTTTERIGLTSAGVLTIKGSDGNAVFTFDSSVGAEFTKPLTIGSAGGIYQGTGTFASPTTGLKIYQSGGVGLIAGYNTGTVQWYATTAGKLAAGGGQVILDAAGINLGTYPNLDTGTLPPNDARSVSFWDDPNAPSSSPAVRILAARDNLSSPYWSVVVTPGASGSNPALTLWRETNSVSSLWLSNVTSVVGIPGASFFTSGVAITGALSLEGTITAKNHILPFADFPTTPYNLGSASKRFGTVYANQLVISGSISGVTLGGQEWEYAGSMTIDANSAAATTVSVTNQGAGTASLDVEGNITLGGTVDSVDIASFKTSYDGTVSSLNSHISATAVHGATGAVVGTTNTQTLTNKTLTTPVIGDFTSAQHAHTNAASGGAIAHTSLTAIGTNDHATIDTHLAATATHGATGAIVGTTNTQTLTNKTLTAPKINDTSANHTYTIGVSELVADRTITLPLLTGNDTFVFESHTQTLANKTLTAPTIGDFTNATHTHASAAQGGTIAHGSLSGIGTNDHATIDSHIAATTAHGATGAVVGTTNTQTLTNKTLTLPKINDTSANNTYIFGVSELAADRTITLPLLTGNDVFVFEAHTQTLANKTLTTPTIASFVNATHAHTNAASGGLIDHGSLTSIGTNSHATIDSHIATTDIHIGHSTVNLIAGAGLTGGGDITTNRTFTIGQGAGITVNADDVALTTPGSLTATSTNSSTGSHTHAIDSTIARSAITMTAGDGLTGGGDLTANRTFAVGVANTGAAGLSVEADAVRLTSSSNPGAAASVLASNASGVLQLQGLITPYLRPAANSTTALQLQNAGGSAVLTVDTTNSRVGIGNTPAYHLDVSGNARITGDLYVDGGMVDLFGSGIVDFGTNTLTEDGTYLQVTGSKGLRLNQTISATSWSMTTAGVLAAASFGFTGGGTFGSDINVANVLRVDVAGTRVGINRAPDQQFDLDVAGPIRGTYLIGKHAIQLPSAVGVWHFDGPEPSNIDYNGTRNSHAGIAATVTGNAIHRPGRYGKAIQLAEATTNYIDNPSFEVAIPVPGTPAYWTVYQTPSCTQNTTDGLYGTKCLAMTTDSVNASPYIYRNNPTSNPALTTGDTWTFSVYIKAGNNSAIGNNVIIYLRENGDAGYTTTASATLTATWQRIIVTRTLTHATPTALNHWLAHVSAAGSGDTILIDGAQLEKKGHATPYCDGSLPGHSWTGTAHNSNSSRTAAELTVAAAVSRNAYTVMGWFKPCRAENATLSTAWRPRFFQIGGYFTAGSLALGAYSNNQYISFYLKNTVDASWTVSGMAADLNYAANEWIFVAASWDGDKHRFYAAKPSTADSMVIYEDASRPDFYGTGANQNLVIAESTIGLDLLDELVVLDYAADTDLIRSIYESDAPVFVESSVFHWRAPGKANIWVDEFGFWASGVTGNAVMGIYTGDPRGAVAYKTWGGINLEENDILIGRNTAGYVQWDDSAQKLYVSGNLTATEGNIGGWYIGASTISAAAASPKLVLTAGDTNIAKIEAGTGSTMGGLNAAGAGTDIVFWAGAMHADRTTAPFRVKANGDIYASSATITGAITATSGSITGAFSVGATLTIGASGALASGATSYASGTGFWLAYNGGSPQFRIGTAAANRLTFDASTGILTIAGNGTGITAISGSNITTGTLNASVVAVTNLNATNITTGTLDAARIAAGTITAGHIAGTTLSAIKADMGTLTAGAIVIGTTNKIWLNDSADGALNIGGATKASAPFRVSAVGVLYATGATIIGDITASSGSFTGAFTLGASGGIYQGSGSFATPTTGLKIWNDTGTGRIGGYSAGALQWYAGTDGKLYAGGGNIVLDATGAVSALSTSWDNSRGYSLAYANTKMGGAFGRVASGSPDLYQVNVSANSLDGSSAMVSGVSADAMLSAVSTTGQATARLYAKSPGNKLTEVSAFASTTLSEIGLSADTTLIFNGYGTAALDIDGWARFRELSSTPSSPTAGTRVQLYMKADKLIIQYNDAGTVRYKYLDLTGTGVTWVHTTTAP